MNLQEDTHYRLKDGNTAYVDKFFAGDEQNPAGFHGSVHGHGLTNWKPNGENMYTSDWDIVRELPNFTPIPMTPAPQSTEQKQGGTENG